MAECIGTTELLQLTGYERVGDLRRVLDRDGVPYFVGKDGNPWTTLDLINQAKRKPGATATPDQPIGAEIL